MSSIRLTYSGLVGLVVRLSSLVTGMIFSVLVTRNLVQEDFGLYALIGSLIAYAMFGHVISANWVPRHIARGEEVGKTALFLDGSFSIVGTIVYLIIAYFASLNTNSDFSIFVIASVLIPATYIANSLDSINSGYKPHAVSYSLVSFEIAKVPLGFALLEPLEMGLVGAILATIFAMTVKIITGIIFAWPRLKPSINLSYVFRWFKLAWLSLYDGVASTIYVLDTFIVSTFLGSTLPLAYYAAATSISVIAGHSGVLAKALGPKLIADARREYVKTILQLYMLVGIPLFVVVIVFAKPLLFLLNPVYVTAVPIVYLLSMKTFTLGMYYIFHSTLAGIERVDTNKNATFQQYRKSNLFLLGTLQYVRTGLYIVSLIILLVISSNTDIGMIDLVIIWALIALIAEISVTVYSMFQVKKANFLVFDWKNSFKYFALAIIVGIISYYLIDYFVVFERDLQVFLPSLIIPLGIAAMIYFLPLYFIDNYFRSLLKAIFKREIISD